MKMTYHSLWLHFFEPHQLSLSLSFVLHERVQYECVQYECVQYISIESLSAPSSLSYIH